MKLARDHALIVVDVQNDFCPGGALAVPEGDEVVPVLNTYIARCVHKKVFVVASRDWHPADHCSFHDYGGVWPPHCIQSTEGAKLCPTLKIPRDTPLVSKASDREKDAYSAFEGTELHGLLSSRGTTAVLVGGLATDYCILNTVLDALRHGYKTYLLLDACRAVNVQKEDGEKAVSKMKGEGAIMTVLDDLEQTS